MPADLFIPSPGWEGVAATLGELRAGASDLAEFLDRQWRDLEESAEELEQRAGELERRERRLLCQEEELAAALELARVRSELVQAQCELLRQSPRGPDETEAALLDAWDRIAELEQEHTKSPLC